MSLGSILFVLAIGIIALLFLVRPFLESWGDESKATDVDFEEYQSASELISQKTQVLRALQDIDFDNALGKIPPWEYSHQRSVLAHRGANILRQLDEIGIGDHELKGSSGAAKRTNEPGRRSDWQRDDLEEVIAARRRSRAGRSPGFCPHCGKPMEKSDSFCSGCGKTAVE